MQAINFKQISNLLFALSFICAVFLLTSNTFGYRVAIQTVFYISGAAALILSLVAAKQEAYRGDFNILFWLGSLLVFLGLIFKTYYLPYSTWIILGGMGVSGLSYFINPFENKGEADDQLLDQ